MTKQSELKINPLIQKLVDVGKGEELIHLEGYIGDSGSGAVRLYGNLNLTYYADIPQEDILHVRNIPEDSDGLVQVFLTSKSKIRLYSHRIDKTIEVSARDIHPNLDDLDDCLFQCALDYNDTSDAYENCAIKCEKKFPINSVGLFANRMRNTMRANKG